MLKIKWVDKITNEKVADIDKDNILCVCVWWREEEHK